MSNWLTCSRTSVCPLSNIKIFRWLSFWNNCCYVSISMIEKIVYYTDVRPEVNCTLTCTTKPKNNPKKKPPKMLLELSEICLFAVLICWIANINFHKLIVVLVRICWTHYTKKVIMKIRKFIYNCFCVLWFQ